ncbi:hypothetical protein DM01DRAFT_1333223 [Hesseltinella vesiculosa]|uniref:Uncharacterized protein n=1 Tax=Hesseltinella vesiculosa TaxID=101127 RepID=A0A1X2GRY8_9FUNG|nr:hypothetical protein DM01DRAFT_1333223 [Hesseltinella vesiculosa]
MLGNKKHVKVFVLFYYAGAGTSCYTIRALSLYDPAGELKQGRLNLSSSMKKKKN